jgi:CheY-like chemotaxis protein
MVENIDNTEGARMSTHGGDSLDARCKRTRRVLLAEDDDEMRQLLSSTLRVEGYQITECAHGVKLAWLLETPSTGSVQPYDIVVSDIRMPGLTALEVMEGLRSQNWPPVILITAFGDAETHETARKLGAVAVLDKPFEMGDFIDVVNKWAKRKAQPRLHGHAESLTEGGNVLETK